MSIYAFPGGIRTHDLTTVHPGSKHALTTIDHGGCCVSGGSHDGLGGSGGRPLTPIRARFTPTLGTVWHGMA